MYRILIADDEELEREGLELMLSRHTGHSFTFYHANNGRTAIQLSEQVRPDIIFMDIKMPGIQGLEALKEIKRHQAVKTVVVTAYDYFNYAQEAVALGVDDYLLKPARRDELWQLVDRLVADIERERREREDDLLLRERLAQFVPRVENELTLLLMMDAVEEAEALLQLLELERVCGYAMIVQFPKMDRRDWREFTLNKRQIAERLKEQWQARYRCLVSPIIGQQLTIFMLNADEPSYQQRVRTTELAEQLIAELEGCTVSIGSTATTIAGLRRSFEEASTLAARPNHIANVRHYEDEHLQRIDYISLADEKRLFDSLSFEWTEQYDKLYQQLLQKTDRQAAVVNDELQQLLLRYRQQLQQLGVVYQLNAYRGELTLETLRHFYRRELEVMSLSIVQQQRQQTSSTMERTKRYIADHLTNDITMEQVAEHVSLSPHYFSKMFKKAEGITFSDYVTNLRIDAAKTWLRTSELSLKEIAYRIGYNDPNYFSRVFKKVTDRTPSEYRAQDRGS